MRLQQAIKRHLPKKLMSLEQMKVGAGNTENPGKLMPPKPQKTAWPGWSDENPFRFRSDLNPATAAISPPRSKPGINAAGDGDDGCFALPRRTFSIARKK